MALGQRTVFLGFFFLCAVLLRGDVVLGMKRPELLAELGKPTTSATRGPREILSFPHGVRIVLREGVVTEIEGYPPDPSLLEGNVEAAKVSAQNVATPTPKPTPKKDKPASAAVSVRSSPDAPWPPPVPNWRILAELAVELVAQYLLALVVIKITCQIQHIDALWSQVSAIAGIDLLLQTLFTVAIVWLTGNLRYGVAGAALPGFAMLWTIRRYCFDEHRNRSGTTAVVAKIAAVGLYVGFLYASAWLPE